MNIVFLSGGSGGHITPALAVASELRKIDPTAQCTFLCSRNLTDADILRASEERYIRMFSGKIRRYISWRYIPDVFFLMFGIVQAFVVLLFLRPDVIFSKGGYVSVPAVLVSVLLRIPVVSHESDTVSGIANRIGHHVARRMLTTFPLDKGECVGSPVRPALLQSDAQKGRDFLRFSDESLPLLLVVGGSQGSAFLNTLLKKNIHLLLDSLNVVWITGGQEKNERYQNRNTEETKRSGECRIYAYLHEEFAHVLACADLVVTRSGSNALFEGAVLGKSMIMIPLASSAGNHQEQNARYFSEKGAGVLLLESDITPDTFGKYIGDILQDTERQDCLKKNSRSIGKNHIAATDIAKILLEEGGFYREKKI